MGTLSDFSEGSKNLFHSMEHVAEKAAHVLYEEAAAAGHQAALFGKGAVSGALLNPINGVEQLLNKAAGTHLPVLEFSNQDEVNNSWAGKAGKLGGTILTFVATDGAVSAATGFARGSAASLAMAGSIQGGVLNASDAKKEGLDFIKDRVENAAIDAVTFATMGGASKKLAPIFDGIGETIAERMSFAALKNGLSGGVGGVANAEATALLKKGRPARFEELRSSVETNALFGAGMGIVGEAVTSLAEALRPGLEAPALTEAELAATRLRLQKLVQVDNNVSPEFVARTTKALERVHDSILQELESQGIKIRVTPKLTDWDPKLAGENPRGWKAGTWEQADGLYNPASREIVIAESCRPFALGPYMQSKRPGVARHELGHGVDDALGVLSRSPEFKAAHSADLAGIPKEWRSRLDYFMQPLQESAGRSEAFADLFAVLHGGPCNGGMARVLRQYFPQTLKVMASTLETLRTAGTVQASH